MRGVRLTEWRWFRTAIQVVAPRRPPPTRASKPRSPVPDEGGAGEVVDPLGERPAPERGGGGGEAEVGEGGARVALGWSDAAGDELERGVDVPRTPRPRGSSRARPAARARPTRRAGRGRGRRAGRRRGGGRRGRGSAPAHDGRAGSSPALLLDPEVDQRGVEELAVEEVADNEVVRRAGHGLAREAPADGSALVCGRDVSTIASLSAVHGGGRGGPLMVLHRTRAAAAQRRQDDPVGGAAGHVVADHLHLATLGAGKAAAGAARPRGGRCRSGRPRRRAGRSAAAAGRPRCPRRRSPPAPRRPARGATKSQSASRAGAQRRRRPDPRLRVPARVRDPAGARSRVVRVLRSPVLMGRKLAYVLSFRPINRQASGSPGSLRTVR